MPSVASFFDTFDSFFAGESVPGPTSGRLVVAFSGGSDSTALLWNLRQWSRLRGRQILAAHVDHGLDPECCAREQWARRLAEEIGVDYESIRHPPELTPPFSEGLETASRNARYAALERVRQRSGASWIVTAHHADDQLETVLLRLLFGSGLEGLAAMRPRFGHIARPLLTFTRDELAASLVGSGLEPVRDQTNHDLRRPRNLVRHEIAPVLADEHPRLRTAVLGLAHRAGNLFEQLDSRLEILLDLRETADGAVLHLPSLRSLPRAIWPFALSALHRRAGAEYPPSAAAQGELARQIQSSDVIRCDCGRGWRLESLGQHLQAFRGEAATPPFAYTLRVPGECKIPELSMRFRLRQAPVSEWMFRRLEKRAGLDLPLFPGDVVVVRNRRAGDRLTPFGRSTTRRLKQLLIDRQVPRRVRDRLPLLEVDGRLAWVPGVAIADEFRLGDQTRAWVAEIAEI